MKKGFAPVLILISVVLTVALGFSAVLIYKNYSGNNRGLINDEVPITKDELEPTNTSTQSDENVHTDNETANWKTHTASVANVSFKLPPSWKVEEQPRGNPQTPGFMQQSIALKGENNFGITYFENYFGGFAGTKTLYAKNVEIGGIKTTKDYLIGLDEQTDQSSTPVQLIINLDPNVDFPNGRFLIASFEKETFEEEDKILDQILSTFKFL